MLYAPSPSHRPTSSRAVPCLDSSVHSCTLGNSCATVHNPSPSCCGTLVVQTRPCHRGYADRTAAVALSTNRRKKRSDWIGWKCIGCFVCRLSCRCDLLARLGWVCSYAQLAEQGFEIAQSNAAHMSAQPPLVVVLTVLPFSTVSSAVGVSAEQHCSTAPEPLLLSSLHRIPHAWRSTAGLKPGLLYCAHLLETPLGLVQLR